MDDRRKYQRKAVNSRIKVFHSELDPFETNTKDISNGGILIPANKVSKKLKENDKVKVFFLNSEDVSIVFNMRIVRITKKGVAMEIINCEKNGAFFSVLDLRKIV